MDSRCTSLNLSRISRCIFKYHQLKKHVIAQFYVFTTARNYGNVQNMNPVQISVASTVDLSIFDRLHSFSDFVQLW